MSEDQNQPDTAGKHQSKARDAACRVARELCERGYIAYFAGGCVRDELMGLEPKDYDVATDALPEEIHQIFNRTHGVGAAFGVILVKLMGQTIEVTTFRSDGTYSDGRHPDKVEFATPEKDARRRDFTINGLFEDPQTDEIIDFVGGRDDMKRGLIRAIGNPHDRLQEDRLRMLRAVRFSARFGFDIEPETEEAIRRGVSGLEGVSRERIGQEIEWMLSHSARARAVELLQNLELDAVVLQEENVDSQQSFLENLPVKVDYPTALAAWWLERKKAASHVGTTNSWASALVLSNRTKQAFKTAITIFEDLKTDWSKLGIAARKRLAAGEFFSCAILLLEAEDKLLSDTIRADIDILKETGISPEPFIDGQDLIDFGMTSGPDFKKILDTVYDAQLEGRITERKAAVDLAQSIISERS